MSTNRMGQDISLPVIISPTGVQAVDPDGEVAVARAAAARGTAMGLSSFASKPIEDVIAANPKLFFQVYWSGGRDVIAERVERARQAGAVGLIVTTDWSFSRWPGLGQPQDPGADESEDHAADVTGGDHSARLAVEIRQDAASNRICGCLTWPAGVELGPPFFAAYGEWMGHSAADLGGHSPGCVNCWGGPIHAQGRDCGSTTRKGRGCRCFGDLGV